MKDLNNNNDSKSRLRTRSSSPPSPSSASSSSSDFEFIVSLSPTSRKSSTLLCPADELFYKGQLLPLHLSPRLSMVRTLLASSSSSDTATASRDSTASSTSSYDLSLDSARPSSATDDDDLKKPAFHHHPSKKSKYFSFSKMSSIFLRKDNANPPRPTSENLNSSSSKRITASAREVIRKYMKKVKPLYEKFTPKQSKMAGANPPLMVRTAAAGCNITRYGRSENYSHSSFSGNLRYPRRRSCVVSCPSSPSHSGVLRGGGGMYANSSSSMEELQSAIEGAIRHCKRSMNEFSEKKGSVHVADVDGE